MADFEPRRCSELFQPHDSYGIGRRPVRRWCEYSRPMEWGEVSMSWYGTAHNWLRVCEKTGKTVTWNKKCDCGLTTNDLKEDEIRNPSRNNKKGEKNDI